MTVLPQLERELRAAHRRGRGRRPLGGLSLTGSARQVSRWLAPALAVAATIVIAAVFLIAVRHGSTSSAPNGITRPDTIVLQGTPLTANADPNAALRASLAVLQRRYAAALPAIRVRMTGDKIVLGGVTAANRAAALDLARTGRLAFLDWEANVLLPNGKPVATGLASGSAAALAISQGGSAAPGVQGSGGLTLYDALKIAARQPAATYPVMSGRSPQLYLFGASGSGACTARAAAEGRIPAAGRCYLAGPAPTVAALTRGLAAGTAADGLFVRVRPGTVILQAADAGRSTHLSIGDPNARFYVLRDNEALSGSSVADPMLSRDQTGEPAVTFRLHALRPDRVPARHRGGRPPGSPRQHAGSDAQPALRGCARRPAPDPPANRLQGVSRRHQHIVGRRDRRPQRAIRSGPGRDSSLRPAAGHADPAVESPPGQRSSSARSQPSTISCLERGRWT